MSVKNHEMLPAPECCLHQFGFPHKALTCFIAKWFIAALKILSLLCFVWSFSLSGLAQHAFFGADRHLPGFRSWRCLGTPGSKFPLVLRERRTIGSDIKQINEALELYFSGWASEHVLSGVREPSGQQWHQGLPVTRAAGGRLCFQLPWKILCSSSSPLCNIRLRGCSCSHTLKVAHSLQSASNPK